MPAFTLAEGEIRVDVDPKKKVPTQLREIERKFKQSTDKMKQAVDNVNLAAAFTKVLATLGTVEAGLKATTAAIAGARGDVEQLFKSLESLPLGIGPVIAAAHELYDVLADTKWAEEQKKATASWRREIETLSEKVSKMTRDLTVASLKKSGADSQAEAFAIRGRRDDLVRDTIRNSRKSIAVPTSISNLLEDSGLTIQDVNESELQALVQSKIDYINKLKLMITREGGTNIPISPFLFGFDIFDLKNKIAIFEPSKGNYFGPSPDKFTSDMVTVLNQMSIRKQEAIQSLSPALKMLGGEQRFLNAKQVLDDEAKLNDQRKKWMEREEKAVTDARKREEERQKKLAKVQRKINDINLRRIEELDREEEARKEEEKRRIEATKNFKNLFNVDTATITGLERFGGFGKKSLEVERNRLLKEIRDNTKKAAGPFRG